MSEDNELSPEIEAALKDISAVDPAVRDQHIAAALGELTVQAQSNGRLRFLSVAAAVVVLVAGGIAFTRNSDDTPPALAADTTVVSVLKASGECTAAGTRDDNEEVGSFALGETTFELFRLNGVIDLFSTSGPCTKEGSIDYWAALEVHTNRTDAPIEGVECGILSKPIARFTDQLMGMSYSFAIILTTDGVSLYLEDRCNELLGSIVVPTSGD
jgi:hypothetical protein